MPTGRITSPSAHSVVTSCPVIIRAAASDDSSGVAWVSFWAHYDGTWHHIGSDSDGSDGWSAQWDCSLVTEQDVTLALSIGDSARNNVWNPEGFVLVILRKSQRDTTMPTGRITSPSANSVVTACPVIIRAAASDDLSGVFWVSFWAHYDGEWHGILTDQDGSDGWSAEWNCIWVANQEVILGICMGDNQDNFGCPEEYRIPITVRK